jgi:hypothetical protein
MSSLVYRQSGTKQSDLALRFGIILSTVNTAAAL